MENREQQILSEIKAMMGAIRVQLEQLDSKMAELQRCVDPEDSDNDPIELDIDIAVEKVAGVQLVIEPNPVSSDNSEALEEPESSEEQEVSEQSESVEATGEIDEVVYKAEAEGEDNQEDEDDDDLPAILEPLVSLNESPVIAASVVTTVAEAMADKYAWRTDMPGSTVRDVRSAISLNDRIIFINHLFDEDPLAFQNAITRINTLNSLDEVIAFVSAEYPQWDLSSELVYRFMMAVRRRVK